MDMRKSIVSYDEDDDDEPSVCTDSDKPSSKVDTNSVEKNQTSYKCVEKRKRNSDKHYSQTVDGKDGRRSRSPIENKQRKGMNRKSERPLEQHQSHHHRHHHRHKHNSHSSKDRHRHRSRTRSRSPHRRRSPKSDSHSLSHNSYSAYQSRRDSDYRPSYKSRNRNCRKSKRDRSRSRSRSYSRELLSHQRSQRSNSKSRTPVSSDRFKCSGPSDKANISSVSQQALPNIASAPVGELGSNCQAKPSGEIKQNQKLQEALLAIEAKLPTIPKYYNANAINPIKIASQEEKRKLLWGDTKKDKATSSAKVWTNLKFQGEHGSEMTEKFRKLMGIKSNEESGESLSSAKAPDVSTTQEKLFQSLDIQYSIARMSTHTHRGVGLGFGSNNRL